MMPGIGKSVRARITLWHLAVLVLTLLVYVLLAQMFLWNQLTKELKASLRDDVEVVERFLEPTAAGEIVWRSHEEGEETPERWVEVRHADGRPIYRNFAGEELFAFLSAASSEFHVKSFHPLHLADGTDLLAIHEVHRVGGVPVRILVARSEGRLRREMGHLLLSQTLCFPPVLLLAWAGGYFIAGRVLSPLKKIVSRARTISAERLHERLPVSNPGDELGQLSITFNEVLSKLDRSFSQMRQFTADASHELRTPLSAIRSVGEIALRSELNAPDCRETVASILEEVEKMTRLVDDLLFLARSDSGAASPAAETVELGGVVRDEVAFLTVLAEEKGQRIALEIEQPCPVRLDLRIFRQALGNILHNAIKYTPEGEQILVRVANSAGWAVVEVADAGPGIGPEHQERIFDRFYRIDQGRSRNTGGTGLGLAIARWAVEVHGGRIELWSDVGRGSTFRICLPVRPASELPHSLAARAGR